MNFLKTLEKKYSDFILNMIKNKIINNTEKYINKKIRDASNEKSDWGGKRSESKAILKNHYEWCKENGRDTSWYQVASNESLNTENSERFVNYEKETRQ